MIHLQTILIPIIHMAGRKTVGDEGNLQLPVPEPMEEIMNHQLVDHHQEDHHRKKILQEISIPREKDKREDLIGRLLTEEHLEEDLQETLQEEEEVTEEVHLEEDPQEVEDHLEEVEDHPEEVEDHPEEVEDHPEEVEDHLEEVEDPQEEQDFINPKVPDLFSYPLIILIQN